MTISATSIRLTEDGKTVYMLNWGEYEDKAVSGPYLGQSGIDFATLAEEYRRARYAEAEAVQEDYCSLSESDFVVWLLAKKILSGVEATHVDIVLNTSFDNAYVPRHWPQCPECCDGRGELEYGAVRRSLNRVATFRRCTTCRHEWDHGEEANDSRYPMLEDNGRDTPGACVPFAISKACGLDFATVLKVCEKHGWNRNGMGQDKAVLAARELGYEFIWQGRCGIGSASPPTLKRLMTELPRGRNYVIGVKGHWLALVDGVLVDNDTNSGPIRRVVELYEVRKAQAIAA